MAKNDSTLARLKADTSWGWERPQTKEWKEAKKGDGIQLRNNKAEWQENREEVQAG